jgi:hypothetical protein
MTLDLDRLVALAKKYDDRDGSLGEEVDELIMAIPLLVTELRTLRLAIAEKDRALEWIVGHVEIVATRRLTLDQTSIERVARAALAVGKA